MPRYFKMPGEVFVFKGKNACYHTKSAIDTNIISQVFFEIKAKGENISKAEKRIEKIVRKFPFNKDRLTYFIIAVTEALQNAVLHGQSNPKRKVGINILYVPHLMLFVGITDDLGPLPIKELKFDVIDKECRLNLSDCHRGYFLMAKLSSMLVYYPDKDFECKEIILGLLPDE